MIKHLGSLTLGAINIGAALALLNLKAAIVPLIALEAELTAKIAANLEAQINLPDPVELAKQIAAAVAQLPATIADIIANSLSNLIAVNADFNADLAILLALVAGLKDLILMLDGALSTGGLHLYTFDGTAGGLAGEIAGELGGGLPGGGGSAAPVKAILIATESPVAWTALSAMVKTA